MDESNVALKLFLTNQHCKCLLKGFDVFSFKRTKREGNAIATTQYDGRMSLFF